MLLSVECRKAAAATARRMAVTFLERCAPVVAAADIEEGRADLSQAGRIIDAEARLDLRHALTIGYTGKRLSNQTNNTPRSSYTELPTSP
jgi:hypothetical protein